MNLTRLECGIAYTVKGRCAFGEADAGTDTIVPAKRQLRAYLRASVGSDRIRLRIFATTPARTKIGLRDHQHLAQADSERT